METISGNIANVVSEVGYQGQFGYVYTFQMTIQTPDGAYKTGRIGSKSQVYPLVSGAPISVEVSSYQGTTRFKKFDPQYGQPPSPAAPQKPPQAAPVAPKSTNGGDMVRIRSMALSYAKDLVCEGKLGLELLENRADEFTVYIMTGKWLPDKPMGSQPLAADGRPIDDDIPF